MTSKINSIIRKASFPLVLSQTRTKYGKKFINSVQNMQLIILIEDQHKEYDTKYAFLKG